MLAPIGESMDEELVQPHVITSFREWACRKKKTNPTPETKIKVHQIIVICHREVLTKRVVAKKWPVAPLVFASLPAPPHSTRNRRCEKK